MTFNTRIKEFHIPVKDLNLATKIYACKPGSTLRGALNTIQNNQIGCLVVSNQERETIGIITERDFLLKICGKGLDLDNEKIEDYMTSHPTTIREDEPMLKVLQYMELGAFRHVIIVDKDDKVKGVISMKDVMNYVLKTIQSKDL